MVSHTKVVVIAVPSWQTIEDTVALEEDVKAEVSRVMMLKSPTALPLSPDCHRLIGA